MTRKTLVHAALFAPLLLAGCSVSHVDAGADAGVRPDSSGRVDGSSGPDAGASDAGDAVVCGDRTCPAGEYCCNASCGICAAPGDGCITLECVDAGPGPGVDAGPPVCGTIAGYICGPDEYCDYGGDATCGGDDGGGYCFPRPTACPDIYMPVCGCDRVTYSNACDAHAAGVGVAFPHPCEMPPPPRDCRTDGCPSGTTCQLCWRDYACLPAGAVC